MFNNMTDTKVTATSEEDLLLAMGDDDTTGKTNDKTNKGKSKDADDDTDKSKKKTNQASSQKSKKDTSSKDKNVSDLSKTDLETALGTDDDDDDDNQDDDQDNQDTDADDKAAKKKTPAKKKAAAATDDDDDKDPEDDDDNEEEKDKDADDDEDKDDNEDDQGGLTVPNFLKARVNLLIEKGEWVDFEGSEDVEWDEDTFADMELQQREYKKEQLANEIMDSFGPIGRDIAEYTKNGGNPDDLIDIFKEQQRVENLSIDTEDQQRAVVLKYATEYQKMKPERAKKYIDTLIADKELASTAAESKEAMETDLKEQSEQLKKDAVAATKEKEKQIAENIKKFSNDVNTLLNARTDIAPEEKKEILRVLTKHDKKLPNGAPVNEFYFKLAEFRKDLPNYLDLVRFVLNPKKFAKTEQNKGKSATADKAFSLLRSDNKKKSAKSADISTATGKAGNKQKTTGFKLL